MAKWTNEDGLVVRFGLDRTTQAETGLKVQEEHVLVLDIEDATALVDADTTAPSEDAAFIPAGSIITDAYLHVTTAFTSGGLAVLDLGTKAASGTIIDDDGIDAAIAVADLTENSVTIGDGALVGAHVAADSWVYASYDTAAFTAGVGKLYVKYIKV